jgi:hypothetical protein
MEDSLEIYQDVLKISNESTQWELVEFEEEFGEKRVGLFNSKNDAINEAKNLIWAIGRGDKSTFSYNAYWKVWTNDPSGMQDGSYSIRKVE